MLTDDRSRYYRLRGREAWALPEPVAWTLILPHSESEESRILGIARSRISQATPAAMYCDNKMLVSEARAQLAQMHPTTAPFEVQLRGSFLHRSVASVAHHTPHTTHHTPHTTHHGNPLQSVASRMRSSFKKRLRPLPPETWNSSHLSARALNRALTLSFRLNISIS